jgi:hypothetical protein
MTLPCADRLRPFLTASPTPAPPACHRRPDPLRPLQPTAQVLLRLDLMCLARALSVLDARRHTASRLPRTTDGLL